MPQLRMAAIWRSRRVRFHGWPVTHGNLELRRPRTIRGKHEGSVTVLDGGTLTLDGMVTGLIRVRAGGAALIRGFGGSVIVECDALLLLAGTVAASLHVRAGGRVEISGTVKALLEEPGAMVVRRPGALIARVIA